MIAFDQMLSCIIIQKGKREDAYMAKEKSNTYNLSTKKKTEHLQSTYNLSTKKKKTETLAVLHYLVAYAASNSELTRSAASAEAHSMVDR